MTNEHRDAVLAFGEWKAHHRACIRCSRVDLNMPASLAQTCAKGALLVKEYLNRTHHWSKMKSP